MRNTEKRNENTTGKTCFLRQIIILLIYILPCVLCGVELLPLLPTQNFEVSDWRSFSYEKNPVHRDCSA